MILALTLSGMLMAFACAFDMPGLMFIALALGLVADRRYDNLKDRVEKLEKEKKDEN